MVVSAIGTVLASAFLLVEVLTAFTLFARSSCVVRQFNRDRSILIAIRRLHPRVLNSSLLFVLTLTIYSQVICLSAWLHLLARLGSY